MKNNGEKWLDRHGPAISTAVMLGFFLALILLFASIAKGEGLEKKLPALEGLTQWGCEVKGPIQCGIGRASTGPDRLHCWMR